MTICTTNRNASKTLNKVIMVTNNGKTNCNFSKIKTASLHFSRARNTRTIQNSKLLPTSHTKALAQRMLECVGAHLWNDLPNEICELNKNNFAKQVKYHIRHATIHLKLPTLALGDHNIDYDYL